MLGTYSYAWYLLFGHKVKGQGSKVRLYGKFRANLLLETYF